MEKLINSIPKDNIYTQKNGEIIRQGFFLRYSTSRNKWICGYGTRQPLKHLDISYVQAEDPVEAVAFFFELLNSKKKVG